MNTNGLFFRSALVSIALAASVAVAQTPPATGMAKAHPQEMKSPDASADLGESSKSMAEVAQFLSQPKLAEVINSLRSNPKAAREASMSGEAYLVKNGVQVPKNMRVTLHGGGGAVASKIKIKISFECCPATVSVGLSW